MAKLQFVIILLSAHSQLENLNELPTTLGICHWLYNFFHLGSCRLAQANVQPRAGTPHLRLHLHV